MPNTKKENDEAIAHEQVAKLEYIEQMLRELRRLASDLDAGMLIYLLEMSSIEAADTLKSRRRGTALLSKSR